MSNVINIQDYISNLEKKINLIIKDSTYDELNNILIDERIKDLKTKKKTRTR